MNNPNTLGERRHMEEEGPMGVRTGNDDQSDVAVAGEGGA